MSDPASFFETIEVVSTLDGSKEPSLLYWPEKPEVLLTGLHSWSQDRFNMVGRMLPYCRERGWALLLPEFRGPNLASNPRAPEAGGSPLARRDIVDATRWVIENRFDRRPATLLAGGSGGAHMTLMILGAEDFTWTAASSWCPITDLAAWHGQNPKYQPGLEAVCGGPPGVSPKIDAEYTARSPLNYAARLRGTRLQLAHGRHDASVPCTQSIKLSEAVGLDAPQFYFSIFDGRHELRLDDVFAFFDRTIKAVEQVQITG